MKQEEDTLSAPNVGTASNLNSYNGTMPTSSTAAKTLFLDAKNAMDAAMSSVMTNRVLASISRITPSLNQIKGIQPKETTSGTYNDTYQVGGGTVTVTGNWSESYTEPTTEPAPNQTYAIKISEKDNMTAVVSGVTVPEYTSPKYTINGKYILNMDLNVTITIRTDANADISSVTFGFSVAVQMGMAMTVDSSDGKGAKFIVAFPFEYSVSNLSIESEEEAQQKMETELFTKLQNTEATLKVYDNANKEIYSIQCKLNELYDVGE